MTYVYARVSTKEQVMSGHSIEAQVERCIQYVHANSFTLGQENNSGHPGVFVEAGESASKKALVDRTAGAALVNVLKKGDHVVVTNVSRLFRGLSGMLSQMEMWDKVGVHVHFVEMQLRFDTPVGKLMLSIIGAIAEWKSQIIGQRVSEGHSWRKHAGDENYLKNRNVKKNSGVPVPDKPDPEFKCDGISQIAAQMISDRISPQPRKLEGKVHAYIRVSTEEQNAEIQRMTIDRWLSHTPEMQDVEVVWYDDTGESAYSKTFDRRPGGAKLLQDLKKGDFIVATRIDRMCRSISNMSSLIDQIDKLGATVVFLDSGLRTDTPFGRLVLKMLSFVAEVESLDIGTVANGVVRANIQRRGVVQKTLPKFLQYKGNCPTSLSYAMEEAEWWEMWQTLTLRVVEASKLSYEERLSRKRGQQRIMNEVMQEVCLKKGWPMATTGKEIVRGFTYRITAKTYAEVIVEIKEMQAIEYSESRNKLMEYMLTCNPKRKWVGPIYCRRLDRTVAVIQKWMSYVNPDATAELYQMEPKSLSALKKLRVIAGV